MMLFFQTRFRRHTAFLRFHFSRRLATPVSRLYADFRLHYFDAATLPAPCRLLLRHALRCALLFFVDVADFSLIFGARRYAITMPPDCCRHAFRYAAMRRPEMIYLDDYRDSADTFLRHIAAIYFRAILRHATILRFFAIADADTLLLPLRFR